MRAGRGTEPPPARVVWALVRGPLPAGLRLRRDCRNRRCVNPYHATPRATGSAPRPTCNRGHQFTPATTYQHPRVGRICVPCRNATARARYQARIRARAAALDAAALDSREDPAC